METDHTPSPAFVSALEGELVRQWAKPRGTSVRKTAALLAALTLTGGLLGAAGVVAVEKVQASREGNTYERVAALRHATAVAVEGQTASRLVLAQKALSEGVVSPTEVSVLQDRHRVAVGHARLALLNLTEVKASRCPPRDELWAPLVLGRDFVAERLEVGADSAMEQLKMAQLLAGRQARVESDGLLATTLIRAAQSREAAAMLALRRNQEYLRARGEFLKAVAGAVETERKALRIDAEFSVERVRLALEALQSELQGLSAAHEAGAVSATQLRDLQGKLQEMQGALGIAQAELQVLQEATGEPTEAPAEQQAEEQPAKKP